MNIDKAKLIELFTEVHDETLLVNLEEWLEQKIVTNSTLHAFISGYLGVIKSATTRVQFYYLKRIAELALKVMPHSQILSALSHDIKNQVELIFWLSDLSDYFNYELFSKNFLLLSPADQTKYLKKIIFLAYKNELSLTVEMLDDLTRIDENILRNKEKYHPGLILDISSHIFIESLKTVKSNGRFLLKNEILKVATDYLFDRTHHFEIKDYFIPCQGRLEYDWKKINGYLTKLSPPSNYLYSIKIQSGNLFNEILSDIRSITPRSYNSNNKTWEFPAVSKSKIIQLAHKWDLLVQLEHPYYRDNLTLLKLSRTQIPDSVIFCQSGTSMDDQNTDLPGVWCEGKKCLGISSSNFLTSPKWENITLLEAIKIIILKDMREDHLFVKDYYVFAGHVNSINRLLQKLYCNNCGHLLHIFKPSYIASHNFNRFCCVNPTCSNRIIDFSQSYYNDDRVVYLNNRHHCGHYVDSRDAKRCSNGFVICSRCGHCCSNKQFQAIHQNHLNANITPPQYILSFVSNKAGHNDHSDLDENGNNCSRPIFYCLKDGNKMIYRGNYVHECDFCGTIYNTRRNTILLGSKSPSDSEDSLYIPLFKPRLRPEEGEPFFNVDDLL